ncbi:MAG: glycosyltransferase family 2 protein, partial [Bacteroidota bacterium]|nr:glycosyltransferase family 2 protein [Bacteroidota bacterium]
ELYGQSGIYVGSTCDPTTGSFTYGGQKLRREDDYVHDHVFPNGEYQLCDLCNANSLLVSASVTEKLGILSDRYTHALADYDYSLRAKRAGFPVLVLPDYCGECTNDHTRESGYQTEPLKKRLNYLFSPKGFAYHEFLYFTRTFFPSRYLRTQITFWIRTFFPGLWDRYKADGLQELVDR